MRRIAILLTAVSVCAQPRPAQEWNGERTRKLEAAVEAERLRQGIVGMSVAVAVEGKLRWLDAFGKADLENEVEATPATLFRTASIAKPITAVAALQLVERGKLDLDAPIQRYVPSFPEKAWPVTVRMLLGHIGGLRHYAGDEMNSTRNYTTVIEPLRIFSADPLAHPPRTKYLYSTYGYNLVGAAVEYAAGMTFMDFIEESVMQPAKMQFTRDDNAREIVAHRSRWYSRAKDGRVVNAILADTSNKIPGGGLLTTAEDLIRFAAAWEQEKLLRRDTMTLQTRRQRLADGTQTGYGLGWNVSPLAGRPAISHGGSQQGCKTLLAIFPERRLTVAILTNSDHAEPEKMMETVMNVIDPVLRSGGVNGISGVVAGTNKRP